MARARGNLKRSPDLIPGERPLSPIKWRALPLAGTRQVNARKRFRRLGNSSSRCRTSGFTGRNSVSNTPDPVSLIRNSVSDTLDPAFGTPNPLGLKPYRILLKHRAFVLEPDPSGLNPGSFVLEPDPSGPDPGSFVLEPDPSGPDPGSIALFKIEFGRCFRETV